MNNTIEYTVLISKFLNLNVQYYKGTDEYRIDGEPLESYVYHEDWNLLMRVVEKIESLGYFVMINKWSSVYTGSDGNRIHVTSIEGNSKIINTWMAVIEFIKWYNKNNT